MEIFIVKRDGAADFEFTGELIASVNDKAVYNDGGRWNVYKLWRTEAGRYVCQKVGRTNWSGEVDRHEAYGTPLTDKWEVEITKFFGFNALAKELYEEAGIDATQKVE